MKLVETKTDREVFRECFSTSSTCVKMWCLTHALLARVEKTYPALLSIGITVLRGKRDIDSRWLEKLKLWF
jgi:hypothetical protein